MVYSVFSWLWITFSFVWLVKFYCILGIMDDTLYILYILLSSFEEHWFCSSRQLNLRAITLNMWKIGFMWISFEWKDSLFDFALSLQDIFSPGLVSFLLRLYLFEALMECPSCSWRSSNIKKLKLQNSVSFVVYISWNTCSRLTSW